MVLGKARLIFRRVHLTVALLFGGIFVLSGLTGSAIAWMHELDEFLNPDLFHVPPPFIMDSDSAGSAKSARSAAPETVQRIVDRLTDDPAYGRPTMLTLPEQANQAAVAWYRSASGSTTSMFALERSRQVMIDPYTLKVNGERIWGDMGFSRRLLMPTLFHLHRYLLAGEAGKMVIGISGIALSAMSMIGIILWFPKWTSSGVRKAFVISFHGSWPHINYRFHRVAGFFVAPVFVVLGFSGLFFNLPHWVTPVISRVATMSTPEMVRNEVSMGRSPIAVEQAISAAQAQFPAARVSRITLPGKPAAPYEVRLRQPEEIRKGDGNTRIAIDAYSGKILRVKDPLNASSGDNFVNWLFPLHSGEAFGNGGRVLISIVGTMTLVFLMTGIAPWLRRKGSKSGDARKGKTQANQQA